MAGSNEEQKDAGQQTDLNNLKQMRKTMKRNITILKGKVEKEGENVDATILECRLQILESYFKQICHITSQIEKINPDDTARDELEELFISSKAKIVSLIKGKRHSSTLDASGLNATTNFGSGHNYRLPNLKLPKFDGKYANYKRFISTFNHLVHNDHNLSNIDKFNYLLSCLTGPALAVVEPFQVSEENYDKALSRLKERYDNNVLIFLDHITQLFNIPAMGKTDPASLRNIIDTVAALRSALLSLGSELDIMNSILIHIVLSKVDSATKLVYDEKQDFENLPSWDKCYKLLSRRCQFLEGRSISTESRIEKSRDNNKSQLKKSSQTFVNARSYCDFCKATDHLLTSCQSFLGNPVAKRFEFIKQSGFCINCFGKGHSVSKCKSLSRCRVCRGSHHTHLHKFSSSSNLSDSTISTAPPEVRVTQDIPPTTATSLISRSFKRAIIPTALVLIKDNLGCMQPVRALLDSCSELNFMTEETAKRLKLQWHHTNQEVSGIADIKTKLKYNVFATVKSRVSSFEWSSNFAITKSISSVQQEEYISTKNWNIPNNLELADPFFFKPNRVDLLISTEIFFDLLREGKITLGEGKPCLINSVFGWIVGGSCTSSAKSNVLRCNIARDSIPLDAFLQRFWEVEEYPNGKSELCETERNCERHFTKNVAIQNDGRIQVRLPFKQNPELLGSSYEIAHKRFLSIERKLQRDKNLHELYCDFMDEYISLGHMSPVTNLHTFKPHYFIPHHCVLRQQGLITKLRVVFDASAKTSSIFSLNDLLMVGPTIQQDLVITLLTFRLHKYALIADIAKMYRQFLVDERDRWFQLILWRKNPNDELKMYQLNTVTYGVSSAPFLAIRCLFHIADTYFNEYPIGASVLKTDLYVDDLLTGGNTIAELQTKKSEITALLSKAGLQLAKWNSNSEVIVTNTSEELKIKTCEEDIAKPLGMSWKLKLDLFCFQYEIPDQDSYTKRSVLSIVAKIFDLLGLLAPVVIRCKILIQEIWLQNLNWDDPLPENLLRPWLQIKGDLSFINKINVPRYVFTSPDVKSEVHGFADASQRAYGCCIYIKTRLNDKIYVNLLIAKSKVAPIKAQSLPRLELCAALLLSRTWQKIQFKLDKFINDVFFWSDSKIVLQWLQMHSSSLTCFVANRISEIQENSKNINWQHVSSKDNPADIVSRGCTAENLPNTIWFCGPDFLRQKLDKWPKNIIYETSSSPIELRKSIVFKCSDSGNVGLIIIDIINKHSSYYRILRIITYIRRVFNKIRPDKLLQPLDILHLTSKELNNTFWIIVAEIQQIEYSHEISCIAKNKPVTSNMQKLSPFLHTLDVGSRYIQILRVGGRLSNAPIPYDAKFPALVPKNHRFVQLYIEFLHKNNLHAGPKVLIALLREKLWVVNAREAVRKIVYSCVHCFHYKPKLMSQIMGNLPADRLRAQRPFLVCGVDFCGPFSTSYRIRGKQPYKTYVAIFVCFASKACHVELVTELSTNAFLLCIKRFVSRRGVPQRIYCDNATNFVGAQRKLREFEEKFLKADTLDDIMAFCSKSGFEFCFIPPRAPYFGGLWEAAVKSTKQLLVKNIAEAHLTFEELNTFVIEVEAILNSRPICQKSDDPNDGEALTPAHLLVGSSLMAIPDERFDDNKISYLTRWQRVSCLKHQFWQLWKRDYVLQLQQRSKWFTPQPNIKIGQLVIVHEDNLPPQKWLLARVTHIVPGADNKVRVVDVSTPKGTLRRSIHKIAPLPCDDNAG